MNVEMVRAKVRKHARYPVDEGFGWPTNHEQAYFVDTNARCSLLQLNPGTVIAFDSQRQCWPVHPNTRSAVPMPNRNA
jgi:hypothetical protein